MRPQPIGLQQSIRFGEDFELDLRLRRLRRGTHVLKLERIPLEILALLLEHKGQIVSREEIVARVWGPNVFLDTDNSVRGAIRKVRYVLKDYPLNSECNANVNTVMHGAAMRGDTEEIIKFLVANGARVDARNKDGKTALDVALERKGQDGADAVIPGTAKLLQELLAATGVPVA